MVGITHNLLFGGELGVVERLGDDVRRMVAYGEQGGKEGTMLGCMTTQHGEGVGEEVIVGYAKMIDYFFARIILLCIDFVVAIGAKKGIHIVVLTLVRHKEHCAVACFLQHGGQP